MTRRSEKTREAIKDSLLSLLASWELNDITMAELARNANISRSSLYAHYRNVREVFDDNVIDFCSGLRPLTAQLRCGACDEGNTSFAPVDNGDSIEGDRDSSDRRWKDLPFCIALRDAGKFAPLVKDGNFLPSFLDLIDSQVFDVNDGYPLSEDLDVRKKRALLKFQMSGCYAVAMDDNSDGDWPEIQQLLDAYIRAGSSEARNMRF